MANQILLPIVGTAAYGTTSAAAVGTPLFLDADLISRIEPLTATTTAIYFASPFALTQKLVLTHTNCGTTPTTNPLTGANQFPVKEGIVNALTAVPGLPTVAVQIPAYVTGTASAPVYTSVVISTGVWS
jgi:hypothetical protein